MTTATRPVDQRSRRVSFEAELDRLVARELEALAKKDQPAAQPARKPKPEQSDPAPEGDAANENVSPPLDLENPFAPSPDEPTDDEGKVIGLARASAKNGAPVLPFSPQEEAFIENVVAFLRQRPNRDLIVEEIWLLTSNREEEFANQGLEEAEAEHGESDPTGEDTP
jgi:uncharacterized membrane protein